MIISLICIAIRHKAELALDHVVGQRSVFCECQEILSHSSRNKMAAIIP